MANEYELPNGNPDPAIAHIKRLSVYVTADGAVPGSVLKFHIKGFTPEDEDETGGTPIAAGKSVDDYVEEFLGSESFGPGIAPTPLDFPLQRKCYVVLKLVGDFWEFSRTRKPVTTKDKHGDDRYYQLRLLEVDGRNAAIIFCAKRPLDPVPPPQNNVRHGINFHVDMLQDGMRMPVTIDPDIENRGKN